MDFVFFALESPLFPGALLALFLAVAARALTKEPETALEAADSPTPALQCEETYRDEVPASTLTTVAPSATPSSLYTTASTPLQSPMTETVGTAICSESDSEPFASDEPTRWL